jgi:hypothetical protein
MLGNLLVFFEFGFQEKIFGSKQLLLFCNASKADWEIVVNDNRYAVISMQNAPDARKFVQQYIMTNRFIGMYYILSSNCPVYFFFF